MDIIDKSSKDILYDESNSYGKEFTQLRVVLELLKLKASHGWSDNSFLELLSLLAKLLPKMNTLPTSTYRAKNLISPFVTEPPRGGVRRQDKLERFSVKREYNQHK
jgi:hypothetical protein